MLLELECLEEDLKPGSPAYDGMPKAHDNASVTEKKAVKMAQMRSRIHMIDQAAEQADWELAQCIVKHVANDFSYDLLKERFDIPASRSGFYKKVAVFYRILYQLRYEEEKGSVSQRRTGWRKSGRNRSHVR